MLIYPNHPALADWPRSRFRYRAADSSSDLLLRIETFDLESAHRSADALLDQIIMDLDERDWVAFLRLVWARSPIPLVYDAGRQRTL